MEVRGENGHSEHGHGWPEVMMMQPIGEARRVQSTLRTFKRIHHLFLAPEVDQPCFESGF